MPANESKSGLAPSDSFVRGMLVYLCVLVTHYRKEPNHSSEQALTAGATSNAMYS